MHDMLSPPDQDTLANLPIFPLPNCVLLPGGLLPLHVFEPRYRELTRDCLAGHHYMGIARLRRGFEATTYGRPPVYERFGVGKIICSEELPDGRFALLLRGVARVELARELDTERAYRMVEAKILSDITHDQNDALDHHRELVKLCDRLAEVIEAGGAQLRDLVRAFESPGMCADAIAAALVMDADARQELLDAVDPMVRIQRTLGHVSHMLCELAPCNDAVN
jgi:Lon protease-like protein